MSQTRLRTNREPAQLVRGKAFHRRVQADWLGPKLWPGWEEFRVAIPGDRRGRTYIREDGDGPAAISEMKPTNQDVETESVERQGRIDIQEDIEGLTAVIEIKSTDWDAMNKIAVRRALRRHRDQVFGYLLASPDNTCLIMIYDMKPSDPRLLELIEDYLDYWSIMVVWWDDVSSEQWVGGSPGDG